MQTCQLQLKYEIVEMLQFPTKCSLLEFQRATPKALGGATAIVLIHLHILPSLILCLDKTCRWKK